MDDNQIQVKITSMKVSDRVRRNANEKAMGEERGTLELVRGGRKRSVAGEGRAKVSKVYIG